MTELVNRQPPARARRPPRAQTVAPFYDVMADAREMERAASVGAIESAKNKPLTPREDEFARQFMVCRNSTLAFERSHDTSAMQRTSIYTAACRMRNAPNVARRIDELYSSAAASTVIDVSKLLLRDFEIVQAAQNAGAELTSFVWRCCRHCHGVKHGYQWIDLAEYGAALAKVMDENEERREKRMKLYELPADDGGYGFSQQREPNTECPGCGGLGTQRAIFADTTKLEGAAAVLFKGVKQTSGGIEFLTHDVDKSADRLYRAFGMYGDDAASVARAAAAGSAAGAAAGARAKEILDAMTPEDAARAYMDASQL